jgi:hypothetical protein
MATTPSQLKLHRQPRSGVTQAMVRLYEIRLGDRRHIRQGWLILHEGAVRGLLLAGEDGEILFGLAFDRRIRPLEEMMIFRDLAEAQAWLDKRLEPANAPSNP